MVIGVLSDILFMFILFKIEDVPLDFEINFSSSRHERMISLQTNRVLQYSKRVNHLSGWVEGQP